MDASTAPLPATFADRAKVTAAWFGDRPVEFGALPATGFSGTSLVRVRPRGAAHWFVLKAFAAGTPLDRAEWVHAFVRHLADAGVVEVPSPVPTANGATLATDAAGHHWELVPFVAGRAAEAPSGPQAAAALAVLARLHAAAGRLPGEPFRSGPPPAVARRVVQARELAVRPWRLRRAVAGDAAHDAFRSAVDDRWTRAIAIVESADGSRALAAVATRRPTEVPLQAVLRDVWGAHVLFAPDCPARVAGIVDVHAASVDTPATDIARLLGSWRRDATCGADPVATWPEAVEAYAAVRPLTAEERELVPFLHAAGIVCGLDNWFRWILEERRTFVAPAAAVARIDRLLGDLPAALVWLASDAPTRV